MAVDFLKDTTFLKALDQHRVKEEYVRITVLSWDEDPISYIQGRVISGSLNIDGSSIIRRTGNLTLFAEEKENDLSQIDTELSINRKIKIEKGILNTVPDYVYTYYEGDELKIKRLDYKELYGEIVWFPLGIFVMFDPTLNHSTSGVTISLSFKDKMCLLNGDAGGVIPASVEFHIRNNELLDGTVIEEPVILSQIIRESVNHFGREDLNKIIIDDVDDQVKSALRWMGTGTLYAYPTEQRVDSKNISWIYTLDQPSGEYESFEPTEDIGFELIDFTYPGENGLIIDAGGTVTDVLDKIIEVLGNFEYFYDVDGYFHFQEIKNYLNITATTLDLGKSNNEINYVIDLTSGKSVYTFDNTNLINTITNAPKYSNVKNDFVVWGVRTTTDGLEIPIRYHVAIDNKPDKIYFSIDDTIPESYYQDGKLIQDYHYGEHTVVLVPEYTDDVGNIIGNTVAAVTTILVVDELPTIGIVGKLYHLDSESETTFHVYTQTTEEKSYSWKTIIDAPTKHIYSKDWREELYYQGVEAYAEGSEYNYYFTDLIVEWPKLYDLDKQQYKEDYLNNPTNIDYFLDIIDKDANVGQYKVSNIGRRSLVEINEKINCVFEPEIPDRVLIPLDTTEITTSTTGQWWDTSGQDYAYINTDIWNDISALAQGGIYNSCYYRITELLYQYTNMNNSITINSLPIYYLEPNTRITVRDDATGIYGDYMIQSISLPLDYSSNMSINASKCQEKI